MPKPRCCAKPRSAEETDGGLHCGALEIVVQAGAHLRIVNLQNWGRGTWHFAHQKAVLQRDASLQWTVAAMGSRLAKVNQHVELAGPGADCQVNGVMFTEGKQHIAYNTLQHHTAPHCHSDFLYKGALQDKSRTVWRGMIKVDPDGATDRRLSAERQPAAQFRGASRFDSRAWKSKPTMSAALMAPRRAESTRN